MRLGLQEGLFFKLFLSVLQLSADGKYYKNNTRSNIRLIPAVVHVQQYQIVTPYPNDNCIQHYQLI